MESSYRARSIHLISSSCLLKNSVSQMVYKHAISTVVPARNVRITNEDGTTIEAVAGE